MTGDPVKQLVDPDQFRRTIARIAHEIVERHADPAEIALVGIRTRGVPIAARLVEHIERFTGIRPALGSVDIALYRDDVASGALPVVGETDLPFPVSERAIILVDDVLYTGRTIRAALDHLVDFGRPRSIQLAVLVDRGHREYPVKADYVGKNVPTSRKQRVYVKLAETDGQDEVTIQGQED